MSDPRLDALADSARNRGLKLVRSRIRTPGKRRFGKVGITDSSGKPVFGMDAKGPIATPEDAAEFLRNLGAKDWGASLDVAVMPRKAKPKQPKREAANDFLPSISRGGRPTELVDGSLRRAARPSSPVRAGEEKFRVRPPPKPKLKIREAKPGDASDLVALMKLLDHDVDAKGVRKRIAALAKQKLPQLVATLDKKVVGLAGLHAMTAIHRDKPVGRITILAVAESARRRGIGRMLTEASEKLLKEFGCGMVEVTSNDRLAKAHAFYRHMGYERTSIRFMKKL